MSVWSGTRQEELPFVTSGVYIWKIRDNKYRPMTCGGKSYDEGQERGILKWEIEVKIGNKEEMLTKKIKLKGVK
jgi:hypothetical protein